MRRVQTWGVLGGVMLGALAAPAAEFIHPVGQGFVLNNQPFKFVGYNLRGACHYGYTDAVSGSTFNDLAYNLDFCESTQARVVRVYCPHKNITQQQTGDRLERLLDDCHERGVYVLVVLIDVYHATGLCPKGDYSYYTYEGCCGLWLLGHEWYDGGYQINYRPQALYLADRFKDHPAIFAWQLGNEIRDIGHGATFKAFCHDMAAAIRSVDPNHMISIGLINASHAETDGVALYAPFDFVATHNYNGGGDSNAWIADELNKPYIVDEAGFDSGSFGPDRTPESTADMQKWFVQEGSSGYMNWALMATPYWNGDGDHMFGIDRVVSGHSADYEGYRTLYASWGSQFAPTSSIAVSPLTIAREAFLGEAVSPDTFEVAGSGITPFNLEAQSDADWLIVNSSPMQATPTPTTVQVVYDTAQLLEGTHVGTIRIDAPFINNSPRTITVTLDIVQRRGDFDDDGDLDQEDFGRFQACMSAPGIVHGGGMCLRADYDKDNDVDVDDVSRFIVCRTAPGVPASTECLK